MSCDGFVVGGIWLRFLEGRDCRELFVLFLKEIIGIISSAICDRVFEGSSLH